MTNHSCRGCHRTMQRVIENLQSESKIVDLAAIIITRGGHWHQIGMRR
jgi:hypothetical protein